MAMNSDTAKAFLAGALLPTLAYYFLWRRQKQQRDNYYDGLDSDDDYDDDDNNAPPIQAGTLPCAQWGLQHAPYKMVFCVNTDLAMGKGKIAAQVGHAAVGCFQTAARKCPAALRAWERTGCAKIALKCPDGDALEAIAARAASKGIPVYVVVDAGRTQIAAGSRTVVGLFGPTSVFEGVTDHLKLM